MTRDLLSTDREALFEGFDTGNFFTLNCYFLLITKSFESHSRPKRLDSYFDLKVNIKHEIPTHRHSDYVSYTTKRNNATIAVKRVKPNFELDSIK